MRDSKNIQAIINTIQHSKSTEQDLTKATQQFEKLQDIVANQAQDGFYSTLHSHLSDFWQTHLDAFLDGDLTQDDFVRRLKIMSITANTIGVKDGIVEGSSGAPIAPRSVLKSADRAKLVKLYDNLQNMLGTSFYDITFHQDHVRVTIKGESGGQNFDYTPYMGSILEYMLDQKMNITPLPEIKIKHDIVEASDFFGKTAYYDPNIKEVVLYTQGRHPKDVMRSFVHEMIHHIQNIEGRLGAIGTSNTNEDTHLLEIEKEAYLLGNITFRNWEDKVKNEHNKD